MAGGTGGGADPGLYLSKIVDAASFATYSVTPTLGFQNTTLVNPSITVPALGAPPAGYEWRLALSGAVRIISSVARSVILGANFNDATTSATHGVAWGVATEQVGIPLSATLVPPANHQTVGFTVDFTLAVLGTAGGTIEFRPGPFPRVEAYLVKV